MEARVKVPEELAVSYDQKWQEELRVQLRQLVPDIQEHRHLIMELRYQMLEQEEAASYDQRKEVE